MLCDIPRNSLLGSALLVALCTAKGCFAQLILEWYQQVILETKRVACDLINDVYDLRLAHRTQKMLQVSVRSLALIP